MEESDKKWVCRSCGMENSSNFCCNCGAAKEQDTTGSGVLSAAEASLNEAGAAEQEPAISAVPPETIRPPRTETVKQPPVAAEMASGHAYSAPASRKVERPFEPEDQKAANILCIVSLILMFILPFICSIIVVLMMEYLPEDSTITQVAWLILGGITTFSPLLSLGMMIYVRVKYPKSTFGKVLMWLYIAFVVIAVIAIIVVCAACAYEIKRCTDAGW